MATRTARTSDLDDGLRTREFKFRGGDYVLQELEIGEYNDLVDKATEKTSLPDGTEEERVNQRYLNTLVLDRALISRPPNVKISRLPMSIYGTLLSAVNTMMFSEETNELAKKDRKNGSSAESEAEKDEAKGNE